MPLADTPLNVQHPQKINNGQPLPEEQNFFPTIQFELYISPFTDLIPVLLKSTPYSTDPTFVSTFLDDDLLKRAFVKTIKPKSPSSKIFSNPRSTNNNLRGAFVTSIHGTHVFTSVDAMKQLCILHEQGVLDLSTSFTPENKRSFKEVRKATSEYGLLSPNTIWDEDAALAQIRSTSITIEIEQLKAKIVYNVQAVHDYFEGLYASIQSTIFTTEDDIDVHVTYLYITSLRAISNIQSKSHFPNLYL